MTTAVRVEHAAARPLAIVHRRARPGELSRVVPEAMGLVWTTLRAANLRGGRNVAVYLDDAITIEVGVEIDGGVALPDNVFASATPTGTVATVAHFGPYQRLNDAHAAIREFCKAGGHKPAGPNWEIYGHWLPEWEKRPDQIRTDVFYLLA